MVAGVLGVDEVFDYKGGSTREFWGDGGTVLCADCDGSYSDVHIYTSNYTFVYV